MASRDKVDVDTFHKSIQYALEKLGKLKSRFARTAVSNFKRKKHEGSGNELVDYSRAPCLGADQKARGLWERDWLKLRSANTARSMRCNTAVQDRGRRFNQSQFRSMAEVSFLPSANTRKRASAIRESKR